MTMLLRDIINLIETVAPSELQESYDNAGLQCGNLQQEVNRVLTCLDVTEETVKEARHRGCQLIVSHHPLLFRGVKCISPESGYISRVLIDAIRNDIAIYAAHTNLDKAEGGTNHYLANLLGIGNLQPLSECGVVGDLLTPIGTDDFIARVQNTLQTRVRYNQEARLTQIANLRQIKRVALCTGSGGEMIAEAEQLGADAFVTGEIRYHDFFGHPNLLLIEAGHYETEQFAPAIFAQIFSDRCVDVECIAAESQINPSPFFELSCI